MARIAISGVVFCWLLVLVETGDAQIVRLGPGGSVSIRAPFAHVDVGPYGGTYVRAPFTSVYAPGYRSPVRYNVYPSAPYGRYDVAPLAQAERDVAQKSLPELQSLLVAHWAALQRDLNRFTTGASWQRYLQLPAGMLGEQPDPLAAATSDPLELRDMLSRYDGVGNASEYRMISRLASFQSTRRLLSLYLDRLSGASEDMPQPRVAEELPPPSRVPLQP